MKTHIASYIVYLIKTIFKMLHHVEEQLKCYLSQKKSFNIDIQKK